MLLIKLFIVYFAVVFVVGILYEVVPIAWDFIMRASKVVDRVSTRIMNMIYDLIHGSEDEDE